ncbi:hypothetical protein Sango_0656300 [Sesamum angolense]|uniref:Uncharacterized protein n=1 Tax=Sesamum angolense TaxID=2727404 RepID=A0AAE1X7Z4_9LAMI|nr:hypothetical protein Sango_0656300 [Sesamum angolense]
MNFLSIPDSECQQKVVELSTNPTHDHESEDSELSLISTFNFIQVRRFVTFRRYNIILTRDDKEDFLCLKKGLVKEFWIKDLGYLKHFHMEMQRSRIGTFVSQHKHVLDLLKETGLLGCRPAKHHRLEKEDRKKE